MRAVIGIDYGTQSARALLIDTEDGRVLCSHTVKYPHGVMEGDLACAEDYEQALWELLSCVTPEKYRKDIAGICIDATSLTLVPVASDGQVICNLPGYGNHPHAQIKLWKCHCAHRQAKEALRLAEEMGEPFLKRTGGTISEEWMLPKLLKIRDEAPEVYQQMDLALDLCEFLTFRLTGRLCRSMGSMSYKGLWAQDLGFPSEAYLNSLRPGFAQEYLHLMRGPVFRPGDRVGGLKEELCKHFGLPEDVAVAAGVLDGHTALVAMGAIEAGDAALVVGTSNVLTIQTEEIHEIAGICGIAKDGLTPGLFGIDSGQSCTGDMLDWYVRSAMTQDILDAARNDHCSVHEELCRRISRPWENRVVAADWWNGSRNAPCDLGLGGVIANLSLRSKPEDLYLALLQGIACGTREIVELCGRNGVRVKRVLATGGAAVKNPLLMQEYANVLNHTVYVANFMEGPALGAAIFAAVASGVYDAVSAAYRKMGVREFVEYAPDENHRSEYEALYRKNHNLREAVILARLQDSDIAQ